MSNNKNLKPFKKGQTGAAHPKSKPLSEHRSKTIAIRVTDAEFAKISKQAKDRGISIARLGRDSLGLN